MIGFLLALSFFIGTANAQDFPGYPPANNFLIGQGAGVPPNWNTPAQARTALGIVGSAFVSQGGRLTLQSGVPVMTTTQATKGTIFFDCFNGGVVPVWNGTSDQPLPILSCEISTIMQTGGTGVLNAAGVFDVWGINVSGALTLCIATNGSGGGWASDTGSPSNTARGTGYSALDYTTRGFVTNKNALVNCYNGSTNEGTIPANQATHLGTIGTDAAAAGKVTWQYGTSAGTPTAGIFNIWNRYNGRVTAVTSFSDTTASWTYALATWREAHARTTWQVTYTVGEPYDAIGAQYSTVSTTVSAASGCGSGIGIDSTTVTSGIFGQSFTTTGQSFVAEFHGIPGVGQHVVAALEQALSAATCTFLSTATPGSQSILIVNGPPM